MAEKVEKREISENSFVNIETKYSNQALIHATDTDVAIGFGTITINNEGKDISEIHTMMRMSHLQFEKLTQHCNKVLEDLKKQKK